jgi:thiol-disulfide isomerase/thioredoxin
VSKSKNSNKTIMIVGVMLLVIVLATGAYFAFIMSDQKTGKTEESLPNTFNNVSQNEDATNTDQNQSTQTTQGSYQVYELSKLALANKGRVVLFFNAKWCPDCQRADANFQKESIPDGLTILSVDYDKYNDLKKKYGVTYQHTFVQVDASGNQIKKWSGSYTVDDVEKNVQK